MSTYYHATNKVFQVGERFSINMFDGTMSSYHASLSEKKKKVNEIFNRWRPNNVISRIKCIYLFDNLRHCIHYAKSEKYKHIYKVRSEEQVFGPFPMVLVNTFYKNHKRQIIREYWNPTKEWKFVEFLASSFIVVKEESLEIISNMDLEVDRDLANHLFPIKHDNCSFI